MSIIDNIMNKMFDNPDEEYDEDDLEDDEEDETPSKGIFRKKNKDSEITPDAVTSGGSGRTGYISEDDDDDDDEEDDVPSASRFSRAKEPSSNITSYNKGLEKVSLRKGVKNMATKQTNDSRSSLRIVQIVPRSEDDATECVELLLGGNAVVLNLEGLTTDHAQRIIDFVSGACYATHGNFQKTSNKIFVASPNMIELSGDFVENLGEGFNTPSFE